ncbi:hypothetical protein A3E65_02840 [Candidatus Kaiserbacteria bacterium RIFCSPHIGHO2_12_FULL_56_13]|uniref:Uncharacterized protein n=1 Tax=Candidatus Kaiserbacteria bacterium RIFCSPHIGHO2_12_FULL_56_13 TaxID=1798505 RepID=A0A1F6EE02_9BACT|nr:MAG: hypothetical protein A3E65_02840 [Candidatus Kaiserbacteria bacterium RIFCSPHIGHO2_12_FULL_56_13]
MAVQVAGELYYDIDGQLAEIKRQLRQPNGYPFEPHHLKTRLQDLIEGRFGEEKFEVPLPPKKAATVLAFREDLSVGPLTKRFIPNKFFVTRPGLYLWNDMQRILKDAKAVEPSEATAKLKSFDLTKNAYDKQIKAKLPEHYEVELWEIAELIEAQKNGEDGPLLTNGYSNIFYVAGFAVDVYWGVGRRKWCVDDWRLGGIQWDRGGRVFSSN